MADHGPHDLRAERATLGALLIVPELATQLGDLAPQDFVDEAHQTVFAAIQALLDDGRPVDLVTVKAFMAAQRTLETVGGSAFLAALTEGIPRTASMAGYADIVREQAVRRAIIRAACNGASRVELLGQLTRSRERLAAAMASDLPLLDLAATPTPPPWLVENLLIEAGSGLLVGHPEAGKSTLALHLAVCVAAQLPFLGRFELGDTKGGVIVIDEEGNPAGTLHRLGLLAQGLGVELASLQDRLAVAVQTGFRFGDPAAFTALNRLCEDRRPSLIIGDAAVRLHSVDEDRAGDVSGLFRDYISELQRRHGCALLLLHHFRKSSREDRDTEWIAMVRGSGDWVGAVDLVLGCFANDSERRVLRHGKARWGDKQPSCYVALEKHPERWLLTHDGQLSGRSVSARDAELEVWAYLNELGDAGCLMRELQDHFKGTFAERVLWSVAKSLEAQGRLRRERDKSLHGAPTRVRTTPPEAP